MPDWKRIVRDRVACLRLQGPAEADLVDELAQHLEDRYRELCGGGASEAEAYATTIVELNDMHPLRAELERSEGMPKREVVPLGDGKTGNFIEDFWRDLRYAIRMMRKSPVFVLFVILTLALGVGANTTVFTVINTLILNPLPVPDSSALAALGMVKASNNAKSAAPSPISYPDLKDYQAKNRVFSSLAGYTSPRTVTWQSDSASQRLFAELVTGNYFSTLALTPARGRFFLPDEDSTPGAHPVAVMNYPTWQARFGGAADIIGKTLRLNNVVFTVIGVAPPQFIGVNAIFGPDLWIPATMAEQLLPNEMQNVFADRSKLFALGIGRLKPGFTRAQAQANVATIAADLAREYPATNQGHTATLWSLGDVLFVSNAGGNTPILFASAGLLIVVGIVLLIACSNVANLLLARAASRQQEIAVRLAIGASRRRLMSQLLTESVFLGFLSGIAGLLLADAALHLLFRALPTGANFVVPKLDATVFVFTLLLSLLAGLLFGMLPALKAARASVTEALNEAAPRTTGRSHKKVTVANALLVGQVAFSFLLLVTAILFLRSIGRAYNIDPGFQTAHLAVVLTNPGQAGYQKPQVKAFYEDVRERVESIPGVQSVSWASNLPLWARSVNGLQLEGRQPRSQADILTTIVDTVDLNYFETAGVAIASGRAFTNLDRENSAPVAIVNEKMARDYWRGDALGKRIQLPGEKQMRQIVGIAKTASYTTWAEPPQLCVYVPLEQHYSDVMTLYVRSKGDPRQILTAVQRELHAAAPQVLLDMRSGRDIVKGGLFFARTGVMLLSVFGLLALGLASVGLYGIVVYGVNQRKREIGLRMALGAARTTVLRLILQQGMSLVTVGLLIGLAAATLTGRLLSRMLYGVSGSDPVSAAAASIVLLSVALLACYLPARGASRVDPLVALREG